MTDYHPNMDLIMALADGELPPCEAARIEAQLDAEARAELAAQRVVIAGLQELRLSSDERRRLRATLHDELGLHRGGGQANGSRHPRRPWFARPLPALAVAALLAVVIAMAVNLVDRPMAEGPARTAEAPMTVTTRAAAADFATVPTSAPARTTTTVATTVTTTATTAEAIAEEQVVDEPTEILASLRVATEQAVAVLDEAEATTTTEETTEAQTTGDPGDIPESFASLGRRIEPLTLEVTPIFLADRPEDFLEFTDAHIADYPDQAFPLAQLPDRAVAQGLKCWEYVDDVADPGDTVSFMGVGFIDRDEGEGYRIERGPPRLEDATDEDASLIFLFTYPDCLLRYFDFRAG